ncbi:MAG: MFS transporter [Deferrisomatales bacterium]|nr:MFS transporter [Deferrisomatales bacterium]
MTAVEPESGVGCLTAPLILWMCVAELLSMLGTFAFPALLPRFMAEWQLTHTQAGWINGAYFAGYAAAVPVLASLTDRMDGRRVYLAGAFAATLSATGFATVVQGFGTALVFRVLGGLGLAGTFIPGLKSLVDRLPTDTQPRAVALYTAAFGLGTSLSFFLAGELERLAGWRWVFGLAAAGALLGLGLAAVVLHPLPPREIAGTGRHLLDFRPVLANRRAVGYILAYAAHTWELFAFRSWAVAFLTYSAGLSAGFGRAWAPATVVAIAGLTATAANVGGGELAQRFGRQRVVIAIMAGSAVYGAALGFGAALPYRLVAVLTVLYGCLVQGDSSALHMGTVANADLRLRGTTMALQSLVGFTTAAVGPLAVGVALDISGGGSTPTSWGFAFLAMCWVGILGPVALRLARGETARG